GEHGDGRGCGGAVGDALEQGQAQGILELPDVEADRGLAQPEGLRSPGEALEPGNLVEGPEVHRVQGHDPSEFLMKIIKTIYFSDSRLSRIMQEQRGLDGAYRPTPRHARRCCRDLYDLQPGHRG